MVLIRESLRAPLVVLCFAITLVSAGCGGSSDSATRLALPEADQQTLQKAAEGRKQKATEKAKLPRAKRNSFD